MDVLTLVWYSLLAFVIYKALDYLYRLPKISKLDSRYILVTGCDTGFGNAVAKRLDGMGCRVFAGCLTETGETDLRKACSERLKTIRIDVSNLESIQRAYQLVLNILPQETGLWGVLNNAGVSGKLGPSDWLKSEDYHKVNSVNLIGLIDVTHTFLPLVKKAKGRIVNTASVFGRYAMQGGAPYTISKFGVEAYSDCLRREMKPFKVSVHIIEPGFHKTSMVNGLAENVRSAYSQLPQNIKDEYGQQYLEDAVEAFLKTIVNGIVSEDLTPVVDAYTHALTAKCPRARYLVGKDAKYLWMPLQILPEFISDFLLEIMASLNGTKPVPAACK